MDKNDPAVAIPTDPIAQPTPGIPRFEELFGQFNTISAVPTDVPKTPQDQIRWYKNGTTIGLYFYDKTNNTWNFIAASSASVSRLRAYLSAADFAFNTQGTVKFDVKDYDGLSEYNTTTGLFTATATGYYFIHCQLYQSTTINNGQNGVMLYINGTQKTFSWQIVTPILVHMEHLTEIAFLTAGDVVRIDAYSQANSSGNVGRGQFTSFLNIHRLS